MESTYRGRRQSLRYRSDFFGRRSPHVNLFTHFLPTIAMRKARLTERVRQTCPSRNSLSIIAKSGIVHLVKDGGRTDRSNGHSIRVLLGLEVSFGDEDGGC